MNTTTFTIESVHGVKQTFVVGLPAKVSNGGTVSKDNATPRDHDGDDKTAGRPAQSHQ